MIYEDRTFKGYELYESEVKWHVGVLEKKIKKLEGREHVCAAVFIAGIVMMAISIAILLS